MDTNVMEAERKFSEYLKQKGLRVTPQRLKILEAFLHADDHVSMEELFLIVRTKDNTIGQVTVYRTLKLLCEAGLAMEIHFSDGIARYELAASDSHHDHMVCVACGKVIEIYDPRIEKTQHELADKYDFLLRGHVHNLYGICSACAAQEQRERQKGGAVPPPRIWPYSKAKCSKIICKICVDRP